MQIRKLVAIGDSITEGCGDEDEHGVPHGFADMMVTHLANAQGESIEYANLAIRGKKTPAITSEQVERAIALKPDIITMNGGGNDIIRPRVNIPNVSAMMLGAARRILANDIRFVIIAGGNPSELMPGGRIVQRRGDKLSNLTREWIEPLGVGYVDNWNDVELRKAKYWADDRVHPNRAGHARIASNVLQHLGVPADPKWLEVQPLTDALSPMDRNYVRTYVLPWVHRRLTGTSTGDGRDPKFGGTYTTVEPTVVA